MTKIGMTCRFVDQLEPRDGYRQDLVRLESDADDVAFVLAFRLPPRQPDDRQEATETQRSVLEDFFDASVLPADLGRRRAGLLIDIKNLASAIAETLEQGFSVNGRLFPALAIALRIAQEPYYRSVARGWSMGRERGKDLPSVAWALLIGTAFHRNLVEFWLTVERDLQGVMESAGADR